jgi:VWFA-related protein
VTRRRFLFAASFFPIPLRAQQDQPTFSAGVKVVNVFATVRSKTGEIVRNLEEKDFSLLEDGRQQTIRYFARESDLPLTIGLLIDTSTSQRRVINAERGASMRFLDTVLRENKDAVFILQFDITVRMRQDLTSSHRQLDDVLPYVDTPTRRELSMQAGGGTLLYDAIIKGADVMKKQQNRKALIVLTDGVDTGSEATLADAIEAAQRADTLVYSILFSDPDAYGLPVPFLGGIGGAPDGRKAMDRISRETGGGIFEVSKKRSIEQIFGLIEDELRSQYSLGFVSDQPVRISEYRKLQVSTHQKGQVVQARDRYWAQR